MQTTILPISLFHSLFRSTRNSSWILEGWTVPLIILSVLIGTLLYFKAGARDQSPLYLLLFISSILALLALSRCVPITQEFLQDEGIASFKPVLAGIIFYPLFVIALSLLAAFKVNSLILLFTSFTLIAMLYHLLRRNGWLARSPFVLFALGDYLSAALIRFIGALHHHSVVETLISTVFVLIFAVTILGVIRSASQPYLPKSQ